MSDQQVIGVDENGRARTLSSDKVKRLGFIVEQYYTIENADMVKEVAKQLSVKKWLYSRSYAV